MSAVINIVDFKTNKIVDDLVNSSRKNIFWGAVHKRNIENEETFDFETLSDIEPAKHLFSRMGVTIPGEDGELREFIIDRVESFHRTKKVYCTASFIELLKKKIIEPIVLDGMTLKAIITYILDGIDWDAGKIEYAGIKKVTFSEPIRAYDALMLIKSLFNIELDFRVQAEGNMITGRFVDANAKVINGKETYEEVTYGKDLIGIERIEYGDRIVSALYCVGPEDQNGKRLKVIVKDENARLRWSTNGKHMWDIYEPNSDSEGMTTARLEELGKIELKKRIKSIVEYRVEAHTMNLKKSRLGDYIRIKDEEYSPPLYLDARIIDVERYPHERYPKSEKIKKYTLGEFVEYSEEEVKDVFNQLKNLKNNTYRKGIVDEKLVETSDSIKTEIETGQVNLPGEKITGMIKAEHIDIDLNLQGGLPQYCSWFVTSGYGGWSTIGYGVRDHAEWYNWAIFDYFYFNKRKRYLYFQGAAGLERTWEEGKTNTAVGFIDVEITDQNLNPLASRSISAWMNTPAKFSIQVDLHSLAGDIPGPYEFYYIRFKPRRTGGEGDLQPWLRLTARYLHN